MNKIIDNLWLGNFSEACKHQEEFDYIFCVMDLFELDRYDREEYFAAHRPSLIYAPVLRHDTEKRDGNTYYTDTWVDPEKTNFIIDTLKTCLAANKKCLVHCAAAQERSPLMVVYYLWKYGNPNPETKLCWLNLEEVYQFVIRKHPPTLYRLEWLKRCQQKF
jgi:hypothetical protein